MAGEEMLRLLSYPKAVQRARAAALVSQGCRGI